MRLLLKPIAVVLGAKKAGNKEPNEDDVSLRDEDMGAPVDVEKLSVYGGLVLRARGEDGPGSLKKVKPGSYIYPYITDSGRMGQSAGLFSEDPSEGNLTDDSSFYSEAKEKYILLNYSIKFPAKYAREANLQEHTQQQIKGSRAAPTYMEVKKVLSITDEEEGGDLLYVEGPIYRAVDPRLAYMDPSESTPFGKGQFDFKKMRGQFDGTYLYLHKSPFSEKIAKMVEEQKKIFLELQDARKNKDFKKAGRLEAQLSHTQRMLRPHANEIYDYKDGLVYFINGSGNWQTDAAMALRKLDLHDRIRIKKLLEEREMWQDPQRCAQNRMHFHTITHDDRYDHENSASLAQAEIRRTMKEDQEAYAQHQEKMRKMTPAPPDSFPGLKEGVELFPHQALLLNSIKDQDRMLIDADPGAGKTLMIICDILQQMKAKKCKRPLVLMPEPLLSQFAQEVRSFSELNPWIINTDAVQRWGLKTEEWLKFLQDAAKAPPNTVYLTSYNWISRDLARKPSGVVFRGKEADHYGNDVVAPRVLSLLKTLGVDALYQDECHIMKNESNQSDSVRHFLSLPIVRGFTGTIMPGNPYDVTGPMSIIHSGVLGTDDDFLLEHTVNKDIRQFIPEAPKMIRSKLRNFGMLSMRRSAWAHLLPEYEKHYHFASLTKDQQKVYDSLMEAIIEEIKNDPKLGALLAKFERELEQGNEDNAVKLGQLLTRFVPLDVFLNSPASAKAHHKALLTGENAVSPKAKQIVKIIKDHFAKSPKEHSKDPEHQNPGKVLVFVQFKDGARNLYENMPDDIKEISGYYEGGMIDVLNRFKNPNDPLKVLFAVDNTLRTGHNIQSVNCIIHADLNWMAGDISQREARSYRIKQKRKVFIHHVIANNTAEMAKMGRICSVEHTVAKANSNFDEEVSLPHITMNLDSMRDFRSVGVLNPYLDRRKEIERQYEAQAKVEEKFYGKKLLAPKKYASIDETFKEAKLVAKLPSTKLFNGNLRDAESMTERELEDLPEEPDHPKVLAFNLENWHGDWYIVCFKSIDPQGFLRRFGFTYNRSFFYRLLRNRADGETVLNKMKKDLEITNEDEVQKWLRTVKFLAPPPSGGLKKKEQKEKQKVRAEVIEVQAGIKGETYLETGSLDGTPMIWNDVLGESDTHEIEVLKKLGFEQSPPIWTLETTRTKLLNFFERLEQRAPQVRIADWKNFKLIVKKTFPGVAIDQFDHLEHKAKSAKK